MLPLRFLSSKLNPRRDLALNLISNLPSVTKRPIDAFNAGFGASSRRSNFGGAYKLKLRG